MSDPLPSTRLEGDAVLADDLARELLGERLVGVLATFDRAHGIHAVPMWYAVIENRILLATGSRSRKVRNLELDPRATLVVHDSRPGYEVCGVSIAGTIEILRGLEAQTLVDRVHGRYVADGAGENAAVRAFLISDDVALRLRPIAALTWDERPSAASAALRARGEAFPLVTTDPR